MADNTLQVSLIIEKLLVKTRNGSQIWSPSLIGGRYQARFGDFTVELQGRLNPQAVTVTGSPSYDATIKITKLDGSTVAESHGARGLLRGLAAIGNGSTDLPSASQNKLNELYAMIADRSEDLETLLGLI